MASIPPAYRAARRIYDPAAVCHYLAEQLIDGRASCDHTFRLTRACFAAYAPDIPAATVEHYLALLGELGAHCDCETAANICGRYL